MRGFPDNLGPFVSVKTGAGLETVQCIGDGPGLEQAAGAVTKTVHFCVLVLLMSYIRVDLVP